MHTQCACKTGAATSEILILRNCTCTSLIRLTRPRSKAPDPESPRGCRWRWLQAGRLCCCKHANCTTLPAPLSAGLHSLQVWAAAARPAQRARRCCPPLQRRQRCPRPAAAPATTMCTVCQLLAYGTGEWAVLQGCRPQLSAPGCSRASALSPPQAQAGAQQQQQQQQQQQRQRQWQVQAVRDTHGALTWHRPACCKTRTHQAVT